MVEMREIRFLSPARRQVFDDLLREYLSTRVITPEMLKRNPFKGPDKKKAERILIRALNRTRGVRR